jgi:inner membrane protein
MGSLDFLRYKTHIVSSLTLGAGVSIVFNYPFHIGYVLGITFGSLLPDIDEPNSFIGRRSFGISKIVHKNYGHRGVIHSIFAWCILTILCSTFPSPFTIGVSLGYLFHLTGDFFSIRSIPLFAPFSNERYKFPIRYRTGSKFEDVLYYFFSLILIYLVFILGKLHPYLVKTAVELLIVLIKMGEQILRFIISL